VSLGLVGVANIHPWGTSDVFDLLASRLASHRWLAWLSKSPKIWEMQEAHANSGPGPQFGSTRRQAFGPDFAHLNSGQAPSPSLVLGFSTEADRFFAYFPRCQRRRSGFSEHSKYT
jgi:hypothetical protein